MTVHTKAQTEVFTALGALLAAMVKEQGESATAAPAAADNAATATPDVGAGAPQSDGEAERFDDKMRAIGEEIAGDFATIAQAHRMLGHAAVGALYPAGMDRVELGARLEELRDSASVVCAAIEQALGALADRYHLHELLRGPLDRAIDAAQGAKQ